MNYLYVGIACLAVGFAGGYYVCWKYGGRIAQSLKDTVGVL